jgi:hypothetical protein
MGLARAGISLVAAISRQATNRVQTRGLRARVVTSRESAAVTRPTEQHAQDLGGLPALRLAVAITSGAALRT